MCACVCVQVPYETEGASASQLRGALRGGEGCMRSVYQHHRQKTQLCSPVSVIPNRVEEKDTTGELRKKTRSTATCHLQRECCTIDADTHRHSAERAESCLAMRFVRPHIVDETGSPPAQQSDDGLYHDVLWYGQVHQGRRRGSRRVVDPRLDSMYRP